MVVLSTGAETPGELRFVVHQRAAELDSAYLEMSERDGTVDPETVAAVFSKARAASAISLALLGEPRVLDEVIYEALLAIDAPDEIITKLEALLV